jgi:microcystin-dependent protein
MPAAFDSTVKAVVPAGSLMVSGLATIPAGYLLCDGVAISRTTFAELFAAIGTTFGAGDGVTTFNKPNLNGRGPIGAGTYTDPVTGLVTRNLGALLGAERHQMTVPEMPSHTHSVRTYNLNDATAPQASGPVWASRNQTPTDWAGAALANGSNATHNNMQPSTVCNFFIKF